jgi:hypothetical protein
MHYAPKVSKILWSALTKEKCTLIGLSRSLLTENDLVALEFQTLDGKMKVLAEAIVEKVIEAQDSRWQFELKFVSNQRELNEFLSIQACKSRAHDPRKASQRFLVVKFWSLQQSQAA